MSTNKTAGSDERLAKSSVEETRGDMANVDAQRTQQDGTAFDMAERRAMLRSDWKQEILPTPPEVPGWHYCWLSTTNTSDPIYRRMQKGYEPVRNIDLPGFAQYTATQGEFEGCVACNEMLLFRIPQELYQEVMRYFHYELPMDDEEMLRANAKVTGQDKNGRDLGEVEGFTSLGKRVKTPTY